MTTPDHAFSDGDKFELETAIADAARHNALMPRHRLVKEVLVPRLERTLGQRRAELAGRWLLRDVDADDEISAQDYLDILGEVTNLLEIIDRHVPAEELSEVEKITMGLARTMSQLHELTEQWKKDAQ